MKPIDPQTLKISDTVHQTILDRCKLTPDRIAFVRNDGSGNDLTYGEVHRLVGRIAGDLRRIGLKKGERVGIVSHNCPEWGLSYLAILAAGGVAVPLDASWKGAEISRAMKLSGVKFLVCSEKWKPAIEKIIEQNCLNAISVAIEPLSNHSISGLAESEAFISRDITGDDPAAIIYTSGTSGDPKGVVLTHGNITANLSGIVQALEFYPGDAFLSILPLHHTFELTCGLLTPLLLGLRIVYSRSLKSRDILDDIQSQKITVMIGVPLLFEKIYKAFAREIDGLPISKKIPFEILYFCSRVSAGLGFKSGRLLFKSMREKVGMSSLRLMVSGAAPLPPSISKWFNIIGFDFLEGYGLSECSPVVAVNRPHDIKFGSVGPPLPNIKIEIENPSTDGVGEIKAKGPNNTPGYLNNPKASLDLIRDGWLYTGDVGKLKNGHLYITGRKKSVIVSAAGKNIYPEEIESALQISPLILESIVLGRKKENRMGEEVHAIIVPNMEAVKRNMNVADSPSPDTVKELIAGEVRAVNEHLADYKKLVHFELRAEEFEKTSSRKIRRGLYQ